MLERVTVEQFAELLGQTFCIQMPDLALDLELILAEALRARPGGKGRPQPFSLVFRGPLRPMLPQGIYPLEQAVMGRLEIFLVPVGPDDTGQRYEAVFN